MKIQEKEPIDDSLFIKVERAKQQWESTVDALPELICMVDSGQRVIRANRALETWKLGSVRDVAGVSFHDLMHPDCQDTHCYLHHLLQDNLIFTTGGRLRQLETFDPVLQRHVMVQVCPIEGESKQNPAAAVSFRPLENVKNEAYITKSRAVIFHDVSDQKRMTMRLQQYARRLELTNKISRSILTASSAQVIAKTAITNLHRLMPVHQAVVLLLDKEDKELRVLANSSDLAVFLKDGETIAVERLQTVSERQIDDAYYVKNIRRLQEKTVLEAQWSAKRVMAYVNHPLHFEGKWLGNFIAATRENGGLTIEDLNILREISELLTIAFHQVKLKENLRETNAELQALLRNKQEILEDISHDLRSPLGLITGFVELMRDQVLGPLTPKQEEALNIVSNKGEHLYMLVQRLLTLQTIGERTLDLEMVDLKTFLQQLIRPWHLPASNGNVSIQTEIPEKLPPTAVDKTLFSQVVTNLLDNALKFSPDGGTITIRVQATETDFFIEFSDEGKGMTAEQLQIIFSRFTQADKEARDKGGKGIGLAICREVMQAHDGEIWATSNGVNQGSTFHLRLPRQMIESSA